MKVALARAADPDPAAMYDAHGQRKAVVSPRKARSGSRYLIELQQRQLGGLFKCLSLVGPVFVIESRDGRIHGSGDGRLFVKRLLPVATGAPGRGG
jgi:hypothetical protein